MARIGSEFTACDCAPENNVTGEVAQSVTEYRNSAADSAAVAAKGAYVLGATLDFDFTHSWHVERGIDTNAGNLGLFFIGDVLAVPQHSKIRTGLVIRVSK